ncbi:uncharacterized protein LOC119295267 isoform X6 [Triticum dicoccoides]|uniref:uncharacterized protein LOC119295267 isoform X6 n=1 Tax=Triticum dicoccoides TaxID=85692 RepID=UPI00188DD42F|nr:uncharacterized protein LOC119295267 isoform X6 [Triticum dicoccoides]
MGVLSRKVLATCGALCYFCPGLRARSRQPVKRYKKILAEIFPKTQDEEPNDRRIGKLCEYAAKNPLRVPKITVYLEQRIYKELRAEQYGFAKVVMLIYRGLLVSYKGQIAHCSALRASATDATIYQSSRGWVCYRGRSCRLAGPCATSTLGSGHGPGNPLSGTRRSLPKSSPEHRTKNQMIGGSGSCASTPPRTLLECPSLLGAKDLQGIKSRAVWFCKSGDADTPRTAGVLQRTNSTLFCAPSKRH